MNSSHSPSSESSDHPSAVKCNTGSFKRNIKSKLDCILGTEANSSARAKDSVELKNLNRWWHQWVRPVQEGQEDGASLQRVKESKFFSFFKYSYEMIQVYSFSILILRIALFCTFWSLSEFVSAILATQNKEYTNKEAINAFFILLSVTWLKFHDLWIQILIILSLFQALIVSPSAWTLKLGNSANVMPRNTASGSYSIQPLLTNRSNQVWFLMPSEKMV